MFPSICFAQEGRSQRHFRASSGGQDLRAWVGFKEAYCSPPFLFFGVDMTPICQVGGKRWFRIWPGLWVGVMKKLSFRDFLWAPISQGRTVEYQKFEEKVVCSDHSSTEPLLNLSSDD